MNGPAGGRRLLGAPSKAIPLLALLQLTLAGIAATPSRVEGQRPSLDTLVPAQPVGYVNDFASVIDPARARDMEDLIRRLRGATGAELAVVTLPSIGDHEAAEVALAIGRKWKIGRAAEIGDQRRNAGLVVLLVPRREGDPNSGQIRIEVGQGLEGIVTDATAGRVRDLMLPQLSAGQYGEGLSVGVRTLSSLIAKGYGVTDSALTAYEPPQEAPQGGPAIGNLLPIIFLIFFFLMASGARGRRRRRRSGIFWGGPWIGGGWGSGGGFGGGGFGGGGFGGFGGGGGFSGGGAGGRF